MHKKIILFFLVCAVFATTLSLGVPASYAEAATINRTAIESEIRSLLAELRSLRDRLDGLLARLRAGDSSVSQSQLSQSVQQTQDLFRTISSGLTIGDRGDDILALQQFLNSSPDTQIHGSGTNSSGQETGIYDTATQEAVVKFQEKYNVAAVVMILREIKKASTTAVSVDNPKLTASLAALFQTNSRKQVAQAGSGGSTAIHTPVSLAGGCPTPTSGSNVLGKSAGMVACYKIPGTECDPKYKCKTQCLRTMGPIIMKCQISGGSGSSGSSGSGSGSGDNATSSNKNASSTATSTASSTATSTATTTDDLSGLFNKMFLTLTWLKDSLTGQTGGGSGGGNFRAVPAQVMPCDMTCSGNADSIIMNAEYGGAPSSGSSGSVTGSGSSGSTLSVADIAKKALNSVLGKKLGSSDLGKYLSSGLSSISSLDSACGSNGQSCSQSQAGIGSVCTKSSNRSSLTGAVGSAGTGTLKAGVAGVCYNAGCTMMLGVDPSTGMIKLKAVPAGSKFYKNVSL